MDAANSQKLATFIRHHLRSELIVRSAAAAVVYFLVGIMFTFYRFNSVHFSTEMSILYGSTVVWAACRFVLSKKLQKKFSATLFKAHNVMVFLNSICWGLAFSILTYERPGTGMEFFYGNLVLCAIVAGSMTSLSAAPKLLLTFLICTIWGPCSVVIWLYLTHQIPGDYLMVVGLLNLLFLYAFSQSKVIRNNLAKRFEYEELLNQEKKELESTVESLRKTRLDLDIQRAKAQNSSKLAALGEMAGGVAHEVNNPLAIILGHIGILQKMARKHSDDEKMELVIDKTSKIAAACDRIASIVRGLRHFSRDGDKDPMTLTSVDVILEDTLSLCRERFRLEGIQLNTNIDKSQEIECRSVQISQVLLNLLGNAADAVKERNHKAITVDCISADSGIEIKVTDSGDGVPADIAQKIFEPFFTTKEVGKGTGLGLSISKGIVEDHHGELVLSAEKSNQFIVRLPLRQPKKKPKTSAA